MSALCPGRIITEIRRLGVNNPVFMLDEIDKIGQDFRGDPASVLLEVLDPEQNRHFVDYYLDVPFDLSRVMFIATANALRNLPAPLLDRLEIILSRVYRTGKSRNSLPISALSTAQNHGLASLDLSFTEDAIVRVIRDYTREAGLRQLDRELATISRKLARLALRQTKASPSLWSMPQRWKNYWDPESSPMKFKPPKIGSGWPPAWSGPSSAARFFLSKPLG